MIDPEDPEDSKDLVITVDIFKFNLFCIAILLLTYQFDDVISSYRSALKVCFIYTNIVMLYIIYKSK
jgi:hypothetical protein